MHWVILKFATAFLHWQFGVPIIFQRFDFFSDNYKTIQFPQAHLSLSLSPSLSLCVYMCVCVCQSECVCVCVCVWEWERERKWVVFIIKLWTKIRSQLRESERPKRRDKRKFFVFLTKTGLQNVVWLGSPRKYFRLTAFELLIFKSSFYHWNTRFQVLL